MHQDSMSWHHQQMFFPGSTGASCLGMSKPLKVLGQTGSKVLYEVRDQGESDQGRKTHFLERGHNNINADGGAVGGNLLNNINQ